MLVNQKKRIELITFDLDNTLWDVTQTIVRAEQSLRQWMQKTPLTLSPFTHRMLLAAYAKVS